MIYKQSIYFLLVLTVLGTAVVYADINCDLCQKSIDGKYYEFKNSNIHLKVCMNCNRTKPHCSACNIPAHASQLKLAKGEKLCHHCVAQAKYCTLCDKRITGQYYKAEKQDSLYCANCYSSHPRCSACGLPSKPKDLDPISKVCRSCIPKLDRCNSCSKVITGTFYEFQSGDGKYCSDCKQNRAKCHVCGVPVGKQYWKYPDGRAVCLKCNERAIIDVKQIEKIMEEVKGLLARHLDMTVETPYTLRVEALNNNSFMDAKKAKLGHAAGSPLTGSELGLYRLSQDSNGSKSEIFLLYGLPIELIYETAAHEYAHAWQAENCPLNQSSEIREGFAQWVAGQVLALKGYSTALEKLEARRDRPYGTGYQRIKSVENTLGREALIEYVKKTLQ